MIDTCDFFVSEGRRLYGQTVPSELPDKQLFTFRNPVGVAAIITAGNFPVAVPSWYLVPALLCGNAVVWKPAEYAPALGQALTELFLAGGLPDGVLNLVQCDGPSAFEGLERRFDGTAGGQGRLHRVFRGRLADRRAVRPPRAVALPRAGRQEPARGDAGRGPRPGRRGLALQRLRHRGPALHVARHGAGARVGPRRVHAPLHGPRRGGRDRRPVRRGAVRADDPRALRRALPRLARADPRPPLDLRLQRHRAGSRATTRAPASSAIPTPGCSATRRSWTG